MLRRTLVLLLVAAASAGCAHHGRPSPAGPLPPGATATRADSGIRGRTMVDGGCPVMRKGTPCPDKPLAARLTITRRGENTVIATTTSDADGTFRIHLNPGEYVLHGNALDGGLLPAAPPVDVSVHADEYTTVTVNFDSGIR